MLAEIGLIIISVAWFIQLFFTFNGKKDIRSEFIIAYLIGVGFLIANYIQTNNWSLTSYFEIGTFVAALLVLIIKLNK